MLPSPAGKSRYRIGSASPRQRQLRAENVPGQQFGAAGRAGDKPLHQLSVAFAFFVRCATGADWHVGGSTAVN